MSDLALSRALPEFAAELELTLHSQGRADLASQVATLVLVDRCRCGDDFCATFYTAAKPDGAHGPGHSNLELESREGMIILDIVDEVIRCVEVLHRLHVQKAPVCVLP